MSPSPDPQAGKTTSSSRILWEEESPAKRPPEPRSRVAGNCQSASNDKQLSDSNDNDNNLNDADDSNDDDNDNNDDNSNGNNNDDNRSTAMATTAMTTAL